MAQSRKHAWLTYVTRNNHLTHALILAESLRRTRTTRRVGVITICTVSKNSRDSLRKAFDDVFLMDDDDRQSEDYENMRAKVFAFSLDIFDKCVLLEPNSLLLENADTLFDEDGMIVPLISGGGSHSDYFLLTPSRSFFDLLSQEFTRRNGSKRSGIQEFLQNFGKKWRDDNSQIGENFQQSKIEQENSRLKHCVMQFCLKKGTILRKECWGPPLIVQFVDGPVDKVKFVQRLQTMKQSSSVGLTEKAVVQVWLNVSDELNVNDQTINSTQPAVPLAGDCRSLSRNEPIAIIGMSCRLPGVNNLEEFWDWIQLEKEHAVSPVVEKQRKTNAGLISGTVGEFGSTKEFGVSLKEVTVIMDPQTRLLYEVLWESLENGGVDPSSLYGSHTGIFTGSWTKDYKDNTQRSKSEDFFGTYMGNSVGASAAKLSFLLGFTGPCTATDSGCSSAIVAVDMAVKSLRCGETNMALAGGVNLLLKHLKSENMEGCGTFDTKADGFGRAATEGCGFLVLKRLSDALRDRDNIWALIRGSAVSQKSISSGLGTSTVHCEALAMQLSLKNAGVKPEQVSFLETHGIGASVDDPKEVAAIAKAYNSKQRKAPLIIGSLGHTDHESCSGITEIIKTVLAMQHEVIPKPLNLATLGYASPSINLGMIPAVIPMEATPWPKVLGIPRLAGVSSCRNTGTDGHVILQEPLEYQFPKFALGLERPLHIVKMSAKSSGALNKLVEKYEKAFAILENKGNFADFAFTGNVGRASFRHRAFMLAPDFKTAAVTLKENKFVRWEMTDTCRKICFLFPGQGPQYPGMARSLFETSPVFRHHFDHCSKILEECYQVSLVNVLWGTESSSSAELLRTIYSQTSIFCVEYCLLKLWESWDIKPDYVLGHGLGEFCAAVAAGMLTFEDALKLIVTRSLLIEALPQGSMLVLKASQKKAEEVTKAANTSVDFAAVNTLDQTVVSGETEIISELLIYCKEMGLKATLLEATHAFHSSHMDAILEEYQWAAQNVSYSQCLPGVQYISGMDGKIVEQLDAEYWVRHTREKINFLEACQTLKTLDVSIFLEIGSHPVLSPFVLQNLEDSQTWCYPSLRRNANDWETILTSLGNLWVAGYKVDWQGFDQPYERKKVAALPLYPFQRVECNETTTESLA